MKNTIQKLGYSGIRNLPGNTLKSIAGSTLKENIMGISPDGGIFYKNGVPKIAIECKFNNETGNAVERWFKNYLLCKNVLKLDRYITILMGPGFYNNNHPERIIATAGVIEGIENSLYDYNENNFLQFYRFKNIQELEEQIEEILKREFENYLG